jgi:aspartate kinase
VIVLKFGGTSVADATRILGVVEIIRARLVRKPVVVVSALAGATDLLVRAVALARAGDREGLEPVLADLERRHRWAVSGAVEQARRRHDLSLAVDALFDELRQLLRSVRILGEGTPRASDALLAFGELLSSRILVAVLEDRGLPATWVDPREVMITDARHGLAEPAVDAISERCRERLLPELERGTVPVLGGFVGATPDGRTTTLGRGGGDTSAAVLGAAMNAEEIQIWSDVDGILSADPRLVPAARTRARVSFAEAAELAWYGAKVLHPASIAPAVRQRIPVRILNSLNPEGPGTVVMEESGPDAPPLASVASRGGARTARVTGRRMRMDAGFLPRVLDAFDRHGLVPDLVVSSEVAVTLALPHGGDLAAAARELGAEAVVEVTEGRAILCVVGSGLAADGGVRGRVLSALAALGPELVALGGSATSVAALIPEERLKDAVRSLHLEFFEEVPA